MARRQFAHLEAQTLRRLRDRIPVACPLVVAARQEGGFWACTLDERDVVTGRFQVVAAWIDGYVAAWTRLSRQAAAR